MFIVDLSVRYMHTKSYFLHDNEFKQLLSGEKSVTRYKIEYIKK